MTLRTGAGAAEKALWICSAGSPAADPMARTRAVAPRAAASPMTDDASPPEYEVDVAGREAAGGDVADGELEDRSVLVREVGAERWPVMPGGYGATTPVPLWRLKWHRE